MWFKSHRKGRDWMEILTTKQSSKRRRIGLRGGEGGGKEGGLATVNKMILQRKIVVLGL